MSNWPYPYCPHLAFNKNKQIRLASIPYTFVPDPSIDAFTNVNVKCANLDKHNIPTLAYQKYMNPAPDVGGTTNFAKDFYLQTRDTNAIKVDNNIVEEQKQQMALANAYILASNATQQYQKFDQGRKNALQNARRRAVSALRSHYQQKKDDKLESNTVNGDWLKKLYHKLEQVAKHIIEGQGEDAAEKQKMFLLSKTNLTSKYLSQIKVRNPKAAFDILEQLRILMLKKKLKFEDQRQEQQKNKSVSMSYTSQASQNTSQGSMLSQATSVNQSNVDGEEEIVAKYCDFESLGKKWGLADVEQVKVMIRLIMTRKFVYQAETTAIKKKREAALMDKSLQKLNPELSKQLKEKKEQKQKGAKSKAKQKRGQSVRPASKKPSSDSQVFKQINLNKQQTLIKSKLLQGGQFDAMGEKYARNRNYSQLFNKREKEIMIQFNVKENRNEEKSKGADNSNKYNKLESTLNLTN